MSQATLGRTLLAPFLGVARWYNRAAEANPLAVGVITSGLKTSAADVFAQKVLEGREELDWTRHAAFCAFGFAYLGGFQYWLYSVKFAQWRAPLARTFGERATAPIKVFIDQAIHHPFMYFPSFFAIKAAVAGQPLSSAADKYKSEIWDSLKALWMVWVPAQFVNFTFVPGHLRIPYVAAVSFGWTVILSLMQGRFDAAIAQREKVLGGAPSADLAGASAPVGATASPPMPASWLSPAAAAVMQQEQAALAAAGSATAQLASAAARALPHVPIVAAAVAEVPARGAVVTKET